VYTSNVRGWESSVLRALKNPAAAWEAVKCRVRGQVLTIWCRLFRPRVKIGRSLLLYGRLKIRGPGRVIIGDNVEIGMLVTPYTHSPEAVITIGDRTFLNGTRFGCRERIDVGARSILAECRITDYDYHSVHPLHRNDPAWVKSRPVRIGENVWITVQCIVLKGVTIGQGSTIAANSLVTNDIPSFVIAGGNPAVVLKKLDVSAAPDQ